MTAPTTPIARETPMIRGSERPIPGKCGAKLKRTDPIRYCMGDPMHGAKRCYMHGGASLKGPALPQYKHGHYTNDLPQRILNRYNEALDDPNLMSTRHDIALVDALTRDKLRNLDAGESGRLWAQTRAALEAFNTALTNNATDTAVRLQTLQTLIQRGNDQAGLLEEILTMIMKRDTLINNQHKREQALEQFVPITQIVSFIAQLEDIFTTHVKDSRTRAILDREIKQLASRDVDRAILEGETI